MILEKNVCLNPCATSVSSTGKEVSPKILLVESALGPLLPVFQRIGLLERASALVARSLEVLGIRKTEVGVEHHFFVGAISALVRQLPLVFGGVVIHGEFRDPASGNNSMIVMVVEDALVGRISPVTFIS